MIDLMKNGLKIYVKKNMQIVCNDRSNEQWTENLFKKNTKFVSNDNEQWAEKFM